MARTNFSKKQIYKYKGDFRCPYCGSKNLEKTRDSYQESPLYIYTDWKCEKCKKKWSESYKLHSIIDHENKNHIF